MNKQIVLFAATILFLNPLSTFAVTDPVLYFSFDEGIGTSTNSVSGIQTGSLLNGTKWSGGKAGVGLAFSGTTGEQVDLGKNLLQKSTMGSISIWFKMSDLTDRNILFSLRNANDQRKYFYIGLDKDGRPILVYRQGESSNEQKTEGVFIAEKGYWYNLVVTADTQRYHMYINGDEIQTSTINSGKWVTELFPDEMQYAVGYQSASAIQGSFNGMIDDLQIFNTNLLAGDVKGLYDSVNHKAPTIPEAAYPSIVFTSSAQAVDQGKSLTLTWTATRATTCSGSWSDAGIAIQGTYVVDHVLQNGTYTITCTNEGKYSKSASVSVQVNPISSSTTSITPVSVTPGSATVMTLDQIQEQINKIFAIIQELQKGLAALLHH